MPDLVARVIDFFNLGPISQEFGAAGPFDGLPHTGIDISVPIGTSVPTPVAGTVTRVYQDSIGGKQVEVTTAAGYRQVFAHLSSIGRKVGDVLTPGESVGSSGATGQVTGPHLHYEVRTPQGNAINPRNFVAEFTGSPSGPQPATAAPAALICPGGGELTQIGPLTFCRYMVGGMPVLTPAAPSGAPVVGGAAKIVDTLSSHFTWSKIAFTLIGMAFIGVGLVTYLGAVKGPQLVIALPQKKVAL